MSRKLRPELTSPPIPEGYLHALQVRIEAIENALETAGHAPELIQEFNQLTGRDFDEDTFRNYWKGVDLDDFAKQAARPKPKACPDVTREELIEVVRRAMPTSGDEDYEYYMEIFDANVAMPDASNLIFYPAEHDLDGESIGDYDPTPEEIVDQALSYQMLALPSPDGGIGGEREG